MKFAIDVIFLNKKRVVVKLRRNLLPWRIAFSLKAHSVLELPVGTIDRTHTALGDQLEIQR